MAEYISRETMIKLLRRMADYAEANGFYYDREVIEFVAATLAGIPAADVAPVVHGHWILEREPNGKPYCFHCSACDDDFHRINIYSTHNYCPNCGAKMDGDDSE